jgi:hypothetical protein
MHENLRRRALESGKTVSNKAKSKPSSKTSSRANSQPASRVNSRLQSRDASDDEDFGGNLSDDTNMSVNSIDEVIEADEASEEPIDVTRQDLSKSIEDLLERKGSSVTGREDSLAVYDRCLTCHYLADTLKGHVSDVVGALVRSVRAETSEKEIHLAIRGIALTAITIEDEDIYETVSPILKRAISDSPYNLVKATAIAALAACVTFEGAMEAEIDEILTFLLEVVSSDGAFIGADDSSEVVAAALVAWGFLASQVEDFEAESEDAIEAFLDQLDSSDVRVQIAAGENIALLYEKSYTPREDDEEEDSDNELENEDLPATVRIMVKRYEPYHNKQVVDDKVQALSKLSSKSLSKKDKRLLHQSFATIARTIEDPRVGLSSHSNPSKMTVRIHKDGEMKVDKWWKFMRLNAIRRLLTGGGFVNHYFEGNAQVLHVLPVIMRDRGQGGLDSPSKSLKSKGNPAKGRYASKRRFLSASADGEGEIWD